MTIATRTPLLDADEKHVEEVHCSECNTPIPAIPNWYAQVRVNFICDACRQKSPRLAAVGAPLAGAVVVPAPVAVAAADDPETALDEAALDPEADVDLEIDEAEPDEAADEAEASPDVV